MTRSFRSALSSGATRPPRSNEVVPSSSEKVKTPTLSKRPAFTKPSSASKSASVSPGKPTMKDVRTATPGTFSRMRSTMPSRLPRPVGRFMRLSTLWLACWRGMSTYFTTFSSAAMTSRMGSLRVAG